MVVNPIFWLVLLLQIVLFVSGHYLFKCIKSGKVAKAICVTFSILAIPALSFPGYYFHFWDSWELYYQFRSIPHIELILVLTAIPCSYFFGSKHMIFKVGTVAVGLMLVTVPFLKQLLSPINDQSLDGSTTKEVVLQSTNSTCGPSSVANLLRKYQIRVSEREVARACFTTRTGTEVWYMMRYLRNNGFKVTIKTSKNGTLPPLCIAGIKLYTAGHFIAIVGKKGGVYHVIDPLTGAQKIPENQIQQQIKFTGFYLELEKIAR